MGMLNRLYKPFIQASHSVFIKHIRLYGRQKLPINEKGQIVIKQKIKKLASNT